MDLKDTIDHAALQKWFALQKKKIRTLTAINIIVLGIDIICLIVLFLFSVIHGIPLFHDYRASNINIPLKTQIALTIGPLVFLLYASILISKERLHKKKATLIVNLTALLVILITWQFYVRAIYFPMPDDLEATTEEMYGGE